MSISKSNERIIIIVYSNLHPIELDPFYPDASNERLGAQACFLLRGHKDKGIMAWVDTAKANGKRSRLAHLPITNPQYSIFNQVALSQKI
jgi:hypothetical protein